MRLIADENVDRPIVRWLREIGHDVIEVAAMAPGSTDAAIIGISRREDRVLLTFDRDIGRLLQTDGHSHPGVLYIRLSGVGAELWERFARTWPNVEQLVVGHFVTLQDHQVRARPLPIPPG